MDRNNGGGEAGHERCERRVVKKSKFERGGNGRQNGQHLPAAHFYIYALTLIDNPLHKGTKRIFIIFSKIT